MSDEYTDEPKVPEPSVEAPQTDLESRLAASPAVETLLDTVEIWFRDHFPGSVVARSVETWNHVHAAKEDLKRRLRDLIP